ncbi:MAG: hypothetical protein ACXABO_03915 [Promethearchaeota archaeon]|jgi:hypothetical protein
MKIGKILVLLGAILTLVSTFFFSFGETVGALGRTQISGIGFLFNIPDIFGNVAWWETFNGGEATLIYIFAIVFILFIFSGVIQLVGLKSSVVAIVGSIIALAFSIFIIIFITHTPPWNINRYSSLFWSAPISDGILPLEIPIIDIYNSFYNRMSLGTITLVIGGGVGLVGGIISLRD